MNERSGAALVVAALILGAAILASSLILRSAISAGTAELAGLREAMAEGGAAARPVAVRPQQPQPGRPDPSRRYSVNVAGAPALGPEQAKVTVVEFADFQCPFCQRVGPTLRQLVKEYPKDVRVVFKHLPLAMHSKAPAAHAAAEAAHRQGKFWEMHDLIFSKPDQMSAEQYVKYAEELGLDLDRFRKDVAAPDLKARIDADAEEARKLGVSGTPSFFLNGRYLSGAQPVEAFKEIVDAELAGKAPAAGG